MGSDKVARGGLYLSMNSERIREEGSVKRSVYRGKEITDLKEG